MGTTGRAVRLQLPLLVQLLLFCLACCPFLVHFTRPAAAVAIGVNWGTVSTVPLPPPAVVSLLQSNGIAKVKLFDADTAVLSALANSGIEVMLGIPNEALQDLASSPAAADAWVAGNVSRFVSSGVDIRFVAVGNEPFLSSYNGQFQPYVVPALLNLWQAIQKQAGRGVALAGIKLVVPCNADAYESTSNLPSQGAFRPDLAADIMPRLASFFVQTGAPFVVNIYPFLSLYQSPDFPQDYAFFLADDTASPSHPLVDGTNVYTNAFDGNHDTLIAALSRIGYPQLPIVIGEIGWPTDGALPANTSAARAFNQGLIDHVRSGRGTPLRPRAPPTDIYLFALLDEDRKSIGAGGFERHWGIFFFDGQPKYPLDLRFGRGVLAGAQGVGRLPARWCVVSDQTVEGTLPTVAEEHARAACSAVDCTSLSDGGSCGGVDEQRKVSYAFNSYYQTRGQEQASCAFGGLATVTLRDPSVGRCRFIVGIGRGTGDNGAGHPGRRVASSSWRVRARNWQLCWAALLSPFLLLNYGR